MDNLETVHFQRPDWQFAHIRQVFSSKLLPRPQRGSPRQLVEVLRLGHTARGLVVIAAG